MKTQPSNPRNTENYFGVNLSLNCLVHNEATPKAHNPNITFCGLMDGQIHMLKRAITSFGVIRKAISHSV